MLRKKLVSYTLQEQPINFRCYSQNKDTCLTYGGTYYTVKNQEKTDILLESKLRKELKMIV